MDKFSLSGGESVFLGVVADNGYGVFVDLYKLEASLKFLKNYEIIKYPSFFEAWEGTLTKFSQRLVKLGHGDIKNIVKTLRLNWITYTKHLIR